MKLQRERLQAAVLAGLVKHGAIHNQEGHWVVDVEALRNWSSRNEIYAAGRKITQADIVEALSGISGVAKSENQESNVVAENESPVMVLPKSVKDLLSSDPEGYGQRNKTALLEPWELGQKHKNWTQAIALESGEQVNMAEMAIAATFHKWDARREDDGRITVLLPQSVERVPFSASMIKEFVGIKPQVTEKGRKVNLDSNPYEFAKKYLPNLVGEKGSVFKQSDFRIMGGGATAEKHGIERNLKAGPSYINFSNANGQFARYFTVNRRNKIVGTDVDVDFGNMVVKQLGSDTLGVVKREEGKEQIVAAFKLLSNEELAPLRDATKQRLQNRLINASPENLDRYTTVGESIMKKIIKEYSITDFLPQRPGEDAAVYYKRIRPLDDPEFVLKEVDNFFSGVGIHIHNLPWAEQLVLSRAILEGIDKERLQKFSKNYGLVGVRSFLSLDYDRKMGNKILDLGENLEPKLAQEVFKKYGEIVDAAKQAENYVAAHLQGEKKDLQQSAVKVRENLLIKAKDMLSGLADAAGQLETVDVLQKLEAMKTSVLMFAATCKNLPEGSSLDFKEFSGTEIENKDSSALSEEEKQEMRLVFEANRSAGYPEKLYRQTVADFESTVREGGHTFRMLKSDGKIIAFLHYDQIAPDRVYVGSLNLHPSAKDSPVAAAMVKSALEENSDKDIESVVWDKNSARIFYTRMLGFKKVGEIADYHGTGENYWKLERPKRTANQEKLSVAA